MMHPGPTVFFHANVAQPKVHQTYTLHLTDGVTTIKAIEIGTKNLRALQGLNPEDHYRPGTKVRLRGPLKLRKGVLILPCGSISMPSRLASSSCAILGGEVILMICCLLLVCILPLTKTR